MNLDTTQTVREVALNIPGATRVFEKLGIDYCCGGNKLLEQACGEAKLQIQQVDRVARVGCGRRAGRRK